MIEKNYYENIIDEIIEFIKINILIYYRNQEHTFLGLKEYCLNNEENKKYKKLDYKNLLYLTEEALGELLNCEFLYDFRTLE